MKTKTYLLFLLVLPFISCSTEPVGDPTTENADPDTNTLYFPPSGSPEWETISSIDLGWNVTTEQALFDFLEDKNTRAFMVLKDGKIVLEWYFGEHTSNTGWYWASAGKTLTAFTVGIAQENGLVNIDTKTSDYLGEGWTSTPIEKENLITVKHQLTMTTGMNDLQFDCVTPDCLQYIADAGTRWAYHNGPYTLLQAVVASASDMEWSSYFNQNLRNKIGMDGFWFSTNGTNNVYFSTVRSMARFGLLTLNDGIWNGEAILSDLEYVNAMRNTSQDLNKAYGYLWWLNGKSTYRAPALQLEFNGELIPNAPADTYAGLGRDDQKLYVVPSRGLVIVRQGDDAGEGLLGPSSFDNQLWEKLNDYMD